MSKAYLNLVRRFREIPNCGTLGNVGTYGGIGSGKCKQFTWDELLQSRFVVVLGEAGTGKTSEFREQVRRSISSGECAFFLDVVRLSSNCRQPLPFYGKEQSRFEEWKKGDAEAVFFLDALEEALLSRDSLVQRLQVLGQAFEDASNRAKIVLSCRISDWDDAAGKRAFKEYIENLSLGEVEELGPKVVQIESLDSTQVRRLIEHFGVEDIGELLSQMSEGRAQPFLARPLDVEYLVHYWRTYGRIGSLSELIEQTTLDRLRETSVRPHHTEVSQHRLLAGLSKLCCYAVLCARVFILLPGFTKLDRSEDDLIDPETVLRDWTPGEIKSLLTRAVFDEATYGTVKVHHRSVMEYFAATYIYNQLNSGIRDDWLSALLIRKHVLVKVVPLHLKAVTGWLCLRNSSLRREVIELEPSILIEQGDASKIPIIERERILENYIREKNLDGEHVPYFASDALCRFSGGLERFIADRLQSEKDTARTQILLLRLAAAGCHSECVSVASEFVLKRSDEQDVQSQAVEVIIKCGSKQQKMELKSSLLRTVKSDGRMTALLASSFYPEFLSLKELGQIFRSVEGQLENFSPELAIFASRTLPVLCPKSGRRELIIEIESIFRSREGCRWLVCDALISMVAVVISELPNTEEPPEYLKSALSALAFEEDLSVIDGRNFDELKRTVQGKPNVRRSIFWMCAEKISKGASSPMRYSLECFFCLEAEDIEWLMEDLLGQDLESQSRKCSMAFGLFDECEWILAASKFADSPKGEEFQALTKRWKKKQTPVRSGTTQEREHQKRVWVNDIKESIGRDLVRFESGADVEKLNVILDKYHQGGLFLGLDLKQLVADFGNEGFKSVAAGFEGFWRRHRPSLSYEQNHGGGRGCTRLGLVGLDVYFMNQRGDLDLCPEEVEIAIRYALNYPFGWPSWLERILCEYPKQSVAVLTPVLKFELEHTLVGTPRSADWSNFIGLPESFRPFVERTLISFLRTASAIKERELVRMMTVLPKCLSLNGQRCMIEISRNRAAGSGAVGEKALWVALLIHLDLREAVVVLGSAGERHDIIRYIFNNSRYLGIFSLASLRSRVPVNEGVYAKLIAMMLEGLENAPNFGVSDDLGQQPIDWNSPDHIIDLMLNNLAGMGTFEAAVQIRKLCGSKGLHRTLRSARSYIDLVAQSSVEASPFTVVHALKWDATCRLPIRCGNDLFHTVLESIGEIADDVERSPFSNRSLFDGQREEVFQKFMAERLNRRADQSGFCITRESELSHSSRPDILVGHSACPMSPVAIEIKVAENWSGTALLDSLKQQLTGKYLRGRGMCQGILLLCSRPSREMPNKKKSRGTRRTWCCRGKRKLDIRALVSVLQGCADEIRENSQIVQNLEVRAIDFYLD